MNNHSCFDKNNCFCVDYRCLVGIIRLLPLAERHTVFEIAKTPVPSAYGTLKICSFTHPQGEKTLTTTQAKPVDLARASKTLATIEDELLTMFLERNVAIRLALVSLIAKQHTIFIGPPGTAKTTLIEELAARFCDDTGQGLTFFSHLMTKFTTVDEVFGPVSFSGMKLDTNVRITAEQLPEAEIAFLDEIWKPSSAILNTLLKLVDQRRFKNGTTYVATPLMSLFGASNELPEGNDLVAIKDRMLLTHQVDYLSPDAFRLLMRRKAGLEPNPFLAVKTTMSRDELRALQTLCQTLPFTDLAVDELCATRADLLDQGIVISDRRNGQCLQLMAANAVVEGRDQVTEDDLSILIDALWAEPGQRGTVSRIVNQHGNPTNARAAELKDDCDSIYSEAIKQLAGLTGPGQKAQQSQIAAEAAGKIQGIITQLEKLLKQAAHAKIQTKRVEQALQSSRKQNVDLLKQMGIKMNL